MNVHSCILVRLLHLFVFSTAQTVPQPTRSACTIPVLLQSLLQMNPPMIGIERHFPESGSGVVSWVATFFRHLFGQMVSNCEKQEVDDDISTDTLKKAINIL